MIKNHFSQIRSANIRDAFQKDIKKALQGLVDARNILQSTLDKKAIQLYCSDFAL